jgi:acyl carrier protein
MQKDSGSEAGHNHEKVPGERIPPRDRFQSAEAIQVWMIARVTATANVDAAELDARLPFTDYGLDSIAVFTLTGDLAEWLDCDLPATLLWEYPTIESLAQHLARKLPGSQ